MAAALAPRAGWQPWSAPDDAWPVTMLPPMEAVLAAKLQSHRGIRGARPWPAARLLGREPMHQPAPRHPRGRHATASPSTSAALSEALDDGRARRALFDDWTIARGDEVRGSAHLFAPDGTNAQNPGIAIGWREDGAGGGAAFLESDDPGAIDDLVRRAADG